MLPCGLVIATTRQIWSNYLATDRRQPLSLRAAHGRILKLLDLPYEQRDLSTADDANEIAKINPAVRVPSLVLESGECLINSNAIIDHLMEVGDPDHGLLPANGAERRAVLRLAAIGHGVMEKAVASSCA